MYSYNVFQWLMVFFIYCFFGWIFECLVVSINEKRFVNRGFLRGPLLPIYGTGAVFVLHAVLPVRNNIFYVFFIGMIVATVLEYITGAAMEKIFKMRYWDYSKHRFQYKGRICLMSSLAWGALSVLLLRVIHKPVENFIIRFNNTGMDIFAVLLTVLFIADFIVSCKAAFKISSMLQEATKIKTYAETLRLQLSLLNAENPDVYAVKQQLKLLMDDAKAEIRDFKGLLDENNIDELRKQIEIAIESAKEKWNNKLDNLDFIKIDFIKAHPNAVSTQFNQALMEIKEKIKKPKK